MTSDFYNLKLVFLFDLLLNRAKHTQNALTSTQMKTASTA